MCWELLGRLPLIHVRVNLLVNQFPQRQPHLPVLVRVYSLLFELHTGARRPGGGQGPSSCLNDGSPPVYPQERANNTGGHLFLITCNCLCHAHHKLDLQNVGGGAQ